MTTRNEDMISQARTAVVTAFLVFSVVVTFLLGRKLTVKVVKERSFAEIMPAKESFVELNGAACRFAGRRLCNHVFRDEEGFGIMPLNKADIPSAAANMTAFDSWLKRRGVRFVYVQAPSKVDIHDLMNPPAFENPSNAMADDLLRRLSEAGVETLDMRPLLAETPDMVHRNFYRGDHHWNNDGAFAAFGILTRLLSGDDGRCLYFTDPENWMRSVIPGCFFGTRARRTGRIFLGYDDLIVYRPKFKTRMSMKVVDKRKEFNGDFQRTNMNRYPEILAGGERWRKSAYSTLYIGGLYPRVAHVNPSAPLKLRVLIIGDSFARPVEAFLSSVVRDLYVIDPRRMWNIATPVECVSAWKPDVVVQLQNPSAFASDVLHAPEVGRQVMFEYGLDPEGKEAR